MRIMIHTSRKKSSFSSLITGASQSRRTRQKKCLTILILTKMVSSLIMTSLCRSAMRFTLKKHSTSDKMSNTILSNRSVRIRAAGRLVKVVGHTASHI